MRQQAIAEKGVEVVLTGGISLNLIAVKLKKGYPTAFKQAVLQSRPSPTSLVWNPPLAGWPVPNASDVDAELGSEAATSRKPASPSTPHCGHLSLVRPRLWLDFRASSCLHSGRSCPRSEFMTASGVQSSPAGLAA